MSISEALAALGTLQREDCISAFDLKCQFDTIRLALEQAEREQRDWEAISKWRLLQPHNREHAIEQTDIGGQKRFEAPTRLEALALAAAWCRKEMGDV